MNIINRWRTSPHRSLLRRSTYTILGTVFTIFYAQLVRAQTATTSRAIVQNPYSLATILAAIAGAVITIFFLRGMYLVLTYASETYGLDDDDATDSEENNALLYGAFAWIVGSAIAIASYGWGWQFLYIGPLVCLLGPLVPIVAMTRDIKKYRQALSRRNAYWGDR